MSQTSSPTADTGACPFHQATAAKAPNGCPISARAAEFDPFEDGYQQDPPEYVRWAREQEPVFYSPKLGYWVVTRYDDIKAIFRDNITFSPSTVSDNAVTVLGQGNSAGNGLALSGSSIDASAALFNSQSMSSAVNASASDIRVDVNADGQLLDGVSQTVTGNSVAVSAGLNDATNALSVDAANTVGGNVGLAGASNDTGSFDGFTGAVADFAVTNLQDSTGTATASLVDARAGILMGDGALGTGGSLTVTGNQFSARAMMSSGDLSFGRINYQLPVGGYGTRIGASWSKVNFEVCCQVGLNPSGEGRIVSLYALHPLARSRNFSAYLNVSYDDKTSNNRSGVAANRERAVDLFTVGTSIEARDCGW